MDVLGNWGKVRTGLGHKCITISNQSHFNALRLWVLPSSAVEVSRELSSPGWNGLRATGSSRILHTSLMPQEQELLVPPQTAFPTLNNPPNPTALAVGQSAKIRDSKDTKGLMSPVKSCLSQGVVRDSQPLSASTVLPARLQRTKFPLKGRSSRMGNHKEINPGEV